MRTTIDKLWLYRENRIIQKLQPILLITFKKCHMEFYCSSEVIDVFYKMFQILFGDQLWCDAVTSSFTEGPLSHFLAFKSWAFYIALGMGLTCNRQNKEMRSELPFEARLQTTLVSFLQSFQVSRFPFSLFRPLLHVSHFVETSQHAMYNSVRRLGMFLLC